MLDKYEDYKWRSMAKELATVKDPRLAELGSSLAVRIREWLLSRGTAEPLEPPPFEDAATLVRSRLTWPIIHGAECAAEIARARSDGGRLILDLFRSAPARSRALMLRFATSPPELADAAIEMTTLGLADRSSNVRSFAAENVSPRTFPALLPALRAAAAAEPDDSTKEYMLQQISHCEKGYWLGGVDEFGLHNFWICTPECTVGSSIPDFVLEELGEPEAARLMKEALVHPQSEAAETKHQWHLRWRQKRGFVD